jgi:hypothetical protein
MILQSAIVCLLLVRSCLNCIDTEYSTKGFAIELSQKTPEPNVHDKFYEKNKENLENRFPLRKHNDPLIYIHQVFYVFGGAIIFIIALMKRLKMRRSYKEIAGWDVSIICCASNLIFAYAFGFVAVVNDWWFFFPDLITSHIWQIQQGQMVLGDVLFYLMATIMGHLAILMVVRMALSFPSELIDNLSKAIWFLIIITIILFGITFGSIVMRGMIYWLYIPFGITGIIFYKKYTGLELWSLTGLFILCEFGWDVFARIRGIWIFPDSSTHPGLYFNEITLFCIGKYPLIWQPEMTQMAFMSGMICIVFFHFSRFLLQKKEIVQK